MRKQRSKQEIAKERYEKAQQKFSIVGEKLRLGQDLDESEKELCGAVKLYGDELTTTQNVGVMKSSCIKIYEKLGIHAPWKYNTLTERVKSLARSLYNEYLKKPVQQLQLI